MADHTQIVRQEVNLTQNGTGSYPDAVAWGPPDALEFIDGTAPAYVVLRGTGSRSDAGKVVYRDAWYHVPKAKSLRVGAREAASSGGRFLVSDRKVHVPVDLVSRAPTTKDYLMLEDNTTRWSIVHVDTILHGTRYRLYCRR